MLIMGSQPYLDIPCGMSAGVILDAEHVADVAKEVVLSSPLILLIYYLIITPVLERKRERVCVIETESEWTYSSFCMPGIRIWPIRRKEKSGYLS